MMTTITLALSFEGNAPSISLATPVLVDGQAGQVEAMTFSDLFAVERVLDAGLTSVKWETHIRDAGNTARAALNRADEIRAANRAAPGLAVTLHAPDAEPVGYTLVTLPPVCLDLLDAVDAVLYRADESGLSEVPHGLGGTDLSGALADLREMRDCARRAASGDADA